MITQRGRLLLYAPNVHAGGGAVLLRSLLDAWPVGTQLVAWLDVRARGSLRLPFNGRINWVEPSVGSRFRAELALATEASCDDRVLCFHGLPPLFRSKGKLIIFQQNRNYLGSIPLRFFSGRTRFRLRFERIVARIFRHRCTSYWVQTPSMAYELQKWFGKEPVNVQVMPFSPTNTTSLRGEIAKWDLIYVADGEAHKNHRRLVEAMVILAREGLRPSLLLTLPDSNAKLLTWIKQEVAEHGLQILNIGQLPHDDLLTIYGQCRALVFPSLSESLGLPLIEAREIGLPIVAGESDFVRDVCEPVQSFDPNSSVSIARAIRRFLGNAESPVTPVSAAEFLKAVTSRTI